MNYEYQEMQEFGYEFEGEFNQEMHEGELAHELLSIQNEGELDQFLGNLVRSAWSGAKALYNSPMGQQLKNQAVAGLKSFGRQAIPSLGRAIGGRFLGSQGAQLGGQVGNWAVRGLGLEFEGANPDDKRFEASRRLIRIARIASRRIVAYAQSGRPLTRAVVRNIILSTGRRFFPSLPMPQQNGFSGSSDGISGTSQSQGTWVRQGNRIILHGL